MSDNKKYANEFERYSTQKHQELTGQETYQWYNISENMLRDSGYIKNYEELRKIRKYNYENNIINPRGEYGIDAMSKEIINGIIVYHVLQYKLYGDKNRLCAHHLGTFWQVLMCRIFPNNVLSKGYIYHTSKLEKTVSNDIKNFDRIISVRIDIETFYESLNLIDVNNVVEIVDAEPVELIEPVEPIEQVEPIEPVIIPNNILLRDYQTLALNELSKVWTGIKSLVLPCGTGKTFICSKYLEKSNYKNIFIFSPLRVHANQFLNYLKPFLIDYKLLLVDCDGTLDITKIKETLKTKCVISTTYKSAIDTISTVLDDIDFDFKNSILIIDEAHNLSANDDGDNDFKKIINKFKKVLFVTATPPKHLNDIYGSETIYEYKMKDAIDNKYICDYKIYLPLIIENSVGGNSIDMDKPKKLMDLDDDLCKKCLFIFNGMLKVCSRNSIVYIKTIKECERYKNTFEYIAKEYHYISCIVSIITSETKTADRNNIINNFQKKEEILNTIKFLLCVRILDEGIDIVKCDSVFITHIGDSTSDIRTVQRICRANRLDKDNPNKVANCFMWCEDLNNAINTLQLLKENDVDFIKKISIVDGNYKNSSEEKLKIVDVKNVELTKYITVKCLSFDEIWMLKKNLLFEFVTNVKETIEYTDVYMDEKIGAWFKIQKRNLKLNINFITDNRYIKLSENKKIKIILDKHLAQEKRKRALTFDESFKIFEEFIKKENRMPEENEMYGGTNIESWFSRQKSKINLITDELYIKLSAFNIVKIEIDKYLEKDKILTFDESYAILVDYINTHDNKMPILTTRHNEKNIGSWYGTQQNKIKTNKDDLYIKLSVNEIVKKRLDDYLKNKEIDVFALKHNKLLEFIVKSGNVPDSRKKYDGVNIGQWLYTQRTRIKSIDDELYKKLSTNLIIKDYLDTHIQNRIGGGVFKISKNALFNFAIKEGRAPYRYENYGDISVGDWLHMMLIRILSNEDELYIELSTNPIIKTRIDENLNKDKNVTFNESMQILFRFIVENKRMPLIDEQYDNSNIGIWIDTEKNKINSKKNKPYKKLAVNEIVKNYLDTWLNEKLVKLNQNKINIIKFN